MTQATIARYQPGGDIYATFLSQYGQSQADAIAAAALSGDETKVNAALTNAQFGNPLNTSTTSILANQLTTDPLGAPLAGLNNVLGNSVLSFLKNPWVLGAVALGLFLWLGGMTWIRGAFSKK